MSQFYKTIVPAGAAIGIGWAFAEGYGIAGIIGLALLGGFIGAMIALIKERFYNNFFSHCATSVTTFLKIIV